jgi:hypothetical protein
MSATDTDQLPDLGAGALRQAPHRVPAARGSGSPLAATLRSAHLEAGRLVASLDLDDAALWARVDAVVAGVSAQAYAVAAALSGQPARQCASRVPPVVRVRELAAAQGALFVQLDRIGVEPAPAAAQGSAGRVRALSRRLPRSAGTPTQARRLGWRTNR